MRSLRYPVVLFDFDHTLFDSHASEQAAFASTLESVGIEPADDVFARYDRINQALWRRVESGDIGPNEVKVRRFETLMDELGRRADPIAMGATFVRGLTDHGELYPAAASLLESLAGRVRLGMVTNGIGSVQRGRLDRLGVADLFESTAISGELGMSKPDPAIFDHTLDELGVEDRAGVVMVGDSLVSDIAGANNASIDSIWFAPSRAVANGVRPTHRVEHLAHVVDVVGDGG